MNKQYKGIQKARKLEQELSELIAQLYNDAPIGSQQESALNLATEEMTHIWSLLKLAQQHEANNE